MKTTFFAFVAAFISTLAVTNGAYAQYSNNIAKADVATDVIKMDDAFTSKNNATTDRDAISARAVKNFRKTYKIAGEAKWYKIEEGYRAGFTADGISNIAFYDKKGNWFASLKGYTEDKLDRNIRKMVKREYFDYIIDYVQEIETLDSKGSPTYLVHLEDAKNIKIIRLGEDTMEVYKEFKKSLGGQ